MDEIRLISEGWNIFKRRLTKNKDNIHRYKGNHKQICKSIIDDCWNGTYFKTSTGHFSAFYMRDFAYSIKHLISLGYKKEVRKTLEYALEHYYSENRVSTTITSKGKCVDVFSFSTDSLPLLLYSLDISGSQDLIEKRRNFFNRQIEIYSKNIIDEKSFLVRRDGHFSTIKDNYYRYSSTYSNVMVALLKNEAMKFKLDFKYSNVDYVSLIKNALWSGSYFYDNLKQKFPSGDANVFPYWTGVFDDKDMIKKSIETIKAQELDEPMALRYSMTVPKQNLFFNLLAPDYEGDVVWAHLGMCYIDVLSHYDKKETRRQLELYKSKIEEYHNFLELYKRNGEPYSSLFYFCDEGMIWASIYLDIYNRVFK
ncbi:MAG: hypothetical protein GWP09_02640 [Nitrospiraceae bacterium]|nr:hypothetical protein [Nitrospiraceae bacterium]